ncbi:hypothetical protein [Geodermatophilus sp. DSM 45219]|uniref:phage upper tail fiber protein n=1 Tax=Geodermatophilus sp. DSM 45219 TaxID=1881103 RepID=UPI0008925E38|nr:hypothetical protein [Geodermatophilus sp. DSM 45219]SDN78868.1 hypothetical protein SAMN05428965_1629 [Geodermatophilus sp. DSM 45219]
MTYTVRTQTNPTNDQIVDDVEFQALAAAGQIISAIYSGTPSNPYFRFPRDKVDFTDLRAQNLEITGQLTGVTVAVPDASPTVKGAVQLTNHLGGTATAPTVPGLASKVDSTDARLSDARTPTAHTHPATEISDASTVGRSVVTAATAAAARTAIGAGTSNLAIGTTATTAKAGNYAPTKADVGLGNVDNTADSAKPVSTATQTALDAKAPLASPTFTGTVSGVTKAHVGLGNVDNTSDASKPVSTAQQTALNGKAAAVTTGAGLWIGTQAQYDAIGTKSATTLYVITA